jgi:hypothetical protein
MINSNRTTRLTIFISIPILLAISQDPTSLSSSSVEQVLSTQDITRQLRWRGWKKHQDRSSKAPSVDSPDDSPDDEDSPDDSPDDSDDDRKERELRKRKGKKNKKHRSSKAPSVDSPDDSPDDEDSPDNSDDSRKK